MILLKLVVIKLDWNYKLNNLLSVGVDMLISWVYYLLKLKLKIEIIIQSIVNKNKSTEKEIKWNAWHAGIEFKITDKETPIDVSLLFWFDDSKSLFGKNCCRYCWSTVRNNSAHIQIISNQRGAIVGSSTISYHVGYCKNIDCNEDQPRRKIWKSFFITINNNVYRRYLIQ